MSASIKGDSKTTELESASRRPPTKRAHCKKFWWAWLAGTIVVVLIVVLVL